MKARMLLAAIVLLAAPEAAFAQYAATQAETLKELERVLVVFAEPNEVMDVQALRELYQNATLELRKVGIRVSTEMEDIDLATDAILNISVIAGGGFSQAVTLRIDVEQHATLVRTSETKQMVTWYYEASRSGYPTADSAAALLTEGVNTFLSDWLDANGR